MKLTYLSHAADAHEASSPVDANLVYRLPLNHFDGRNEKKKKKTILKTSNCGRRMHYEKVRKNNEKE